MNSKSKNISGFHISKTPDSQIPYLQHLESMYLYREYYSGEEFLYIAENLHFNEIKSIRGSMPLIIKLLDHASSDYSVEIERIMRNVHQSILGLILKEN